MRNRRIKFRRRWGTTRARNRANDALSRRAVAGARIARTGRRLQHDAQEIEHQPGQTVCDMGCGNGFYTLKLSPLVGDHGQVLAVDIQPEMLHLLDEQTKEAKLTNIKPILGSLIDPRLPEGKVDLILCVDVYHEFSHPEQMLAAMRKALAPRGDWCWWSFAPKIRKCRSSRCTK